MNKLILLSIFALTIFSCGRKSVPVTSNKADVKSYGVKEIDFRYFSSKSKIEYNDGDQDIHATVNIRMKKDSVIWMSVNPALGIEAARILFRQDSVLILDRIHNTFSAYSYAQLSEMVKAETNFSMVQALILGNLMLGIQAEKKDCDKGFDLIQTTGNYKIVNTIDKTDLKIKDVAVDKTISGEKVTVNYSEFAGLSDYLFAYKVLVKVFYKKDGNDKQTEINIQHNKAELPEKPLTFPFQIPKKFDEKN